jgi:hypothetical protein
MPFQKYAQRILTSIVRPTSRAGLGLSDYLPSSYTYDNAQRLVMAVYMRTVWRIAFQIMLAVALVLWGCRRVERDSSDPQTFVKSTNQDSPDGEHSTSEITSEEYAVYSALLKTVRTVNGKRAELLVIATDTAKPTTDDVRSAAICQQDVLPGERQGPYLLSDDVKPLVDDLLMKSERTYSFSRRFGLSRPYTLLRTTDFNALFDGRGVEGWNVFYEQFRGAEGFKTLSRVGFNADKTRALVYVVSAYTTIDTFTTFVLLQKAKGEWSRVEAYTCNSGRGGVKPEVP